MTITFGAFVSQKRKELGISQKDLAGLIMREEDGQPISPQYLNDIEKDRRQPTSDHMMDQFAKVLQSSKDYLFYLAGVLPADIPKDMTPEAVDETFKAFRRS
jgi:transcriptional regulator with XRE-family HTH domain